MPRRQFTGFAAKTRLTAPILAAATSFSIETNAGWPTGGANGPFYVTLDPDTATEERVLVTTQSGGSCTGVTRGVDLGGSSSDHGVGAVGSVIHSSAAVDYDEANRHIYNTTDDNHTQYMKTDGTRHDLSARHTYGAALGTRPVPIAVGTSLLAGSGVAPAAGDHQHTIGPGAINAAAMFQAGIVDANAIGASAVGSSELASSAVIAGKIAAAAIDDQSLFSTDTQPFSVQAGDPGAIGANKIWFDTTNRIIKIRNAANSGWDNYGFGESFDQVYEEVDYWENVALGGGNAYRAYVKIGKFVYVTGGFVLGGTGVVSGEIRLQLPFTARALPTSEQFACGARCLNAGPSNVYSGTSQIDGSGTTMRNAVLTGASAQWDAGTPFTPWDINDRCWFFGGYWIA